MQHHAELAQMTWHTPGITSAYGSLVQVALAARPATAWFLSQDERRWLQERQDEEQIRRESELAKSGRAWGT